MFPDSWNVCRRQMLIGDLAEVLWLFLNHYTQLHAETLLLLLISPPPTTPPRQQCPDSNQWDNCWAQCLKGETFSPDKFFGMLLAAYKNRFSKTLKRLVLIWVLRPSSAMCYITSMAITGFFLRLWNLETGPRLFSLF